MCAVNRIFPNTIFVSALILIALFSLTANASTQSDSVRIGLTQYGAAIKQMAISSSFGPTTLVSGDSRITCKGSVLLETTATQLTCKVDNTVLKTGAVVTLSPEDPSAFLVVSSPGRSERQYRGSIEFTLKSDSIKLVNILHIEDYLKGVLPAEIGSSSPEEALKAQAIVARTYTLTNAAKHSAMGYGLCDSTCCQTYSGVSVEKERCTKAITNTSGQVIYYGDKLAEVFYSTDCGGVTQSYEEAYKKSFYPYLCAVPDPFELKHTVWEQSLKLPEIGVKLVKAGVKEANGIQSIKIAQQGPSGRAQSLEIIGKLGTATITSNKLRAALGYDVIKSTLFTLDKVEDGSVVIKGKGWGHGIGLCQTGAVQLAKEPHDYTCDKIIAHYFPGTRISPLRSTQPTAALAAAGPRVISTASVPTIKTTTHKPSQAASNPQPPARNEEKNVLFQVRVKAPDSL